MSFIHQLSVGHFQFPAVDAPAWPAIVRPLEPALVTELLRRFADGRRIDAPTFESKPITWEHGYITGPWWTPAYNAAFASFARALVERADCRLADVRHRRAVDLAELAR